MKLAKDIITLLYENDCVIIPNLGGFIANKKKAEVNPSAKFAMINSRVILFNNQLSNNDGLVANFLVNRYSITYGEALRQIEQFVAQINQELTDRRNAELSGLGTFYLTKEEKLIFIPYHSVNFEKRSYGLPKLRLTELQSRQVVQTPKPELANTPVLAEVMPEPSAPAKVVQELRHDHRDERLRELQARRMKRMALRDRNRKRLGFVNIVGALLLMAMAVGVVTFEMKGTANNPILEANLSDTESINTDVISKESTMVNKPAEEKVQQSVLSTFAICIDKVNSEKEAVEIANELNPKFAQSRIERNKDGTVGVFIISFSNQSLALEYKSFLEQKLRHTLIIKQK